MSYLGQFCFARKLTPGRQTFILCLVFCILYSTLLFSITTPSLFAGSAEASASPSTSSGSEPAEDSAPESIEGLTAKASDGWAATYGGGDNEHATSIHQTTDGGYIVAGGTESFGAGDQDVWVLKLRPDGTVEWQKTYGGVKGDGAFSIQQTNDGGYIVAGATSSFGVGKGDLWALKLKPDGGVEWQKTYGGDHADAAYSVRQTSDRGYIMAGLTGSFGAGAHDFWVLKLKPDGSRQWQKTYGGAKEDWANSIEQKADGGYIVAGKTSSFGAGANDFWVLKLRPDGTVEWQKTYGGDYEDWANSIQQTKDGGYIVAGKTNSFGAEWSAALVLKLEADGTVEWQKTYRGGNFDKANSIQQTKDGGYIVAGNTAFLGPEVKEIPDLWVLKLRPDGSVEWQKAYRGVNGNSTRSIQQTTDGGYIVAGKIKSSGVRGKKNSDLLVLKLRPDGSIDLSCDFVRDTSISEENCLVAVKDTSASVGDSDANPRDSPAMIRDTKVPANILRSSTAIEP